MDIDCCQNVRVSNCTVNSPWDDAIVPKSSFALGYNRACENMTITNCFVTGCYQLGTVLDGTWKKFPRSRAGRRHRAHQVRHRVQRRIQEHHHLQLRLRGLPGTGAGDRRRRAAGRHRRHQHHHARHRQLPHLPSPRRAPARPKGPATRAPSSARCAASCSPTSSATTPRPASAPTSPASPATPSKTSRSPMSSSSASAEAPPIRSRSRSPSARTDTPSRECLARCPRMASTSVTSTGWR